MEFDEIGIWSEVKLAILKEYAFAYSRILSAQQNPSFYHVYVDGFAEAGKHISKTTNKFVAGSPLNALAVEPPFREFFLVDLEETRVEYLRELIGPRNDVHLFYGDCNDVLLNTVFPQIKYENYRRGLCILDPYGLNLDWEVIRTAGGMKTLDIFINFPVEGMNRNVLWRDPQGVPQSSVDRMNRFWGDDSWRDIAYDTRYNLFGAPEKVSNETIAEAFRNRLMKVAGFARVPEPMPMRNRNDAVVYYLFFASPKDTAEHIVTSIFHKYR